jgi:hypothetical protein
LRGTAPKIVGISCSTAAVSGCEGEPKGVNICHITGEGTDH